MDVFQAEEFETRRRERIRRQRIARQTSDKSTIPAWGLDFSVLLLGISSLAIVCTHLSFHDTRFEYNAWTYCAIIPLIVLGLDLVLSSVVSKFVERTAQAAVLMSIILHLLLTAGAWNFVLFATSMSKLDTVSSTTKASVAASNQQPSSPEYFREPEVDISSASSLSRRPDYLLPARTESALPQVSELDRQDVEHSTDVSSSPSDVPEATTALESDLELQHQDIQYDAPQIESQSLNQERIALNKSADSADLSSPIYIPESQPGEEDVEDSLSNDAANDLVASKVRIQSDQTAARRREIELSQPSETDMIESPTATMIKPNRVASAKKQNLNRFRTSDTVGVDRMIDELAAKSSDNARREQALKTRGSSTGRGSTASSSSISIPKSNSAEIVAGGQGEEGIDPGDLSSIASGGSETGRERRSTGGSKTSSSKTSVRPSPAPGSGIDEMSPSLASSSKLSEKRRSSPGRSMRTNPAMDLEPSVGLSIARVPSRVPSLSSNRGAPNQSQIPIPAPAFQQRMARNDGTNDLAQMGEYGPETEAAIELGLEFLSRTQRGDGSWHIEDYGDEPQLRSNTAATGLALLAFQGAGYSHQQYQYSENCKLAIEFLIANQRENGDFYIPMDNLSDANLRFYSHSIASLAVCEAYGMTQDPALRDVAQRAVNFMVLNQDPKGGGWRYQPRTESDTSVSGWFMMALKSAELAGLEVPKSTFAGIEAWLDKAQAAPDKRYLYRYNPFAPDTSATRAGRQVNPTMTGVGLLMRLYLGWRRDNEDMVKGADYLLQHPPTHGTVAFPLRDTYYWYYATQVLFHMGGERWRIWNSKLHPLLIKTQIVEGNDSGSWNPAGPIPDRWGPFAGRLYVTTLNLLSLEVYYRHLPIYENSAK